MFKLLKQTKTMTILDFLKDLYTPLFTAQYVNDKWIIGYNHDINVFNGLCCTQEQADLFLEQRIRTIEHFIRYNIHVPLSDSKKKALISLIHDIGIEEFSKSNMINLINKKDWIAASNSFLFFNKNNRVVSAKIARRRMIEKNLFDFIEK